MAKELGRNIAQVLKWVRGERDDIDPTSLGIGKTTVQAVANFLCSTTVDSSQFDRAMRIMEAVGGRTHTGAGQTARALRRLGKESKVSGTHSDRLQTAIATLCRSDYASYFSGSQQQDDTSRQLHSSGLAGVAGAMNSM